MHGKKMTYMELIRFLQAVGRAELYSELEELSDPTVRDVRSKGCGVQSYYLKAVKASLIALGYDEKWVEIEFDGAFKDYYKVNEKLA